jgi:hypothetical protein
VRVDAVVSDGTGIDSSTEDTVVEVFEETDFEVIFGETVESFCDEMVAESCFGETFARDFFNETIAGEVFDETVVEGFFNEIVVESFFDETDLEDFGATKVECAFGEVEIELIFDKTDTETLFDEICVEDIDDKTIVGAGEASVNERTDSNRRKERGMNIISNVQRTKINTLRTLHLNLQSSIEHTYNPEIVVDAMQHYCLVTDSVYVTFNNVSIHRYSDPDYFEPPLHSRDYLRFMFPSTCLRG